MRSWSLLLLLFPLNACSAEVADDDGAVNRPTCEFTPQALELDEVTPLGFSAGSALSAIEGTHTCSWRWNDPGELGKMNPAPADTAAEVSIHYDGAGVEYLKGDRVGGDPLVRLACPSSMQVYANLTLRTEGGALNRTFDVPIVVHTEGYAGVSIDLADTPAGYAFAWRDVWPHTSRHLLLRAEPSGVVSGELREEAHEDPIVVAKEASVVGAVFRAADWPALRALSSVLISQLTGPPCRPRFAPA